MRYIMQYIMYVLLGLLLAVATGCQYVKSTDQRLKIAYDTYTTVVDSAATLCEQKLIPKPTCGEIAEKAEQALTALDTAQAILTGVKKPVGNKDARYWLQYGIELLNAAKKQMPKQSATAPLVLATAN